MESIVFANIVIRIKKKVEIANQTLLSYVLPYGGNFVTHF